MRDVIRSIIVDKILNGEAVADDQELLISGIIDSLAIMRLVRLLEDAFKLKIPAEDIIIEHFGSIDAMVLYLEKPRTE